MGLATANGLKKLTHNDVSWFSYNH